MLLKKGKVDKGLKVEDFKALYKNEIGWDLDNQPQPIIFELLNDVNFVDPILDIGCGYGTNSIFLGTKGYNIHGVDFIKEAVSVAQKKFKHKNVTFMFKDIFKMGSEFKNYKTILDIGLFHNLSDLRRKHYVENLLTHLLPGSYVYILGFDKKCCTNASGPLGLSKCAIEETFAQQFDIVFIKNSKYLTKFNGNVDAFFVKLHKN